MRNVISDVTPVLCLFGLLVVLPPTTVHAQATLDCVILSVDSLGSKW